MQQQSGWAYDERTPILTHILTAFVWSTDFARERKLSEHPIAQSLANAFADVIRAKAKYKYGDIPAARSQQVNPRTPMKTRDFAYTKITFKTYGDDTTTSEQDARFMQNIQDTVSQGATTTATSKSDQVQQQVPPTSPTPTTPTARSSSSTVQTRDPNLEKKLNEKLAAIEKEMSELEALKKELAAMKGEATARRRLLDSGLPGWDPGVLFSQVCPDVIVILMVELHTCMSPCHSDDCIILSHEDHR